MIDKIKYEITTTRVLPAVRSVLGEVSWVLLYFRHCGKAGQAAFLPGVLFGSTFDLPMDLKNGIFGPDHSQHIMDYVFSHFIGISATASVALTIYITVKGKKSHMSRQLIVPSLVSGVIWGIAQVAFFQANIQVGFAIAFPIIGSLPGIIGLFIGCCCLGEVRTTRSRIFSLVRLLLRVKAVVLITLSSL